MSTKTNHIPHEQNIKIVTNKEIKLIPDNIYNTIKEFKDKLIDVFSITNSHSIDIYNDEYYLNIFSKLLQVDYIPWVKIKFENDSKTLNYFKKELLKNKDFLEDFNKLIKDKEWLVSSSDLLYLKYRYWFETILILDNSSVNKEEISKQIDSWHIDGIYSPDYNKIKSFKESPLLLSEKNSNLEKEGEEGEIVKKNKVNYKNDLSIMIWRFNPPNIGHIRMMKNALRESKELVIFLWTDSNEKDLLSFKERKNILEYLFREEINNKELTIEFIDDVEDDKEWFLNIKNKLEQISPNFNDEKVSFYTWDINEPLVESIKKNNDILKIENLSFTENKKNDFPTDINWKNKTHYKIEEILELIQEEKNIQSQRNVLNIF